MTFRLIRALVCILGITGVLLLLSDVLVRDQALPLAAVASLAGSAVLAILTIPTISAQTDDAWTKVGWGKFFVAIVYASITAACLVAMAHTPDAARFVHAARAAL